MALPPIETETAEAIAEPRPVARLRQSHKPQLTANHYLKILHQLSESVAALSYCLYLPGGPTHEPAGTYSKAAEWRPETPLSLIEPPFTIQLDPGAGLCRQLECGEVAVCRDWSLLHTSRPASATPTAGPILLVPVVDRHLLGFLLLIHEAPDHRWPEHELRFTRLCAGALSIALSPVAGPVDDGVGDSNPPAVQPADAPALLPAHAAQLQTAREEERAVIARELHDEFAQVLTAIKLDLHWLKRRLSGQQSTLLSRIDEMTNALDQTMHRVWDVASNLRPQVLENLGLAGAIEWQLIKLTERTGAVCHGRVDNLKQIAFVKEAEIALYRIVQEALANIARHANATRVDLTIRTDNGQLEIRIADDGPGMPPTKIYDANSLGLAGMRERAGVFGGSVLFESSADGSGTTVIIRMPL
jgi:signal transduction histidine kinase